MDIEFEGNKLKLPFNKVSFKQNIDRVLESKGRVIVLLDIPNEDDTLDNVFALDMTGKKLWRIQPLKEFNPEISQFSPYVGINLLENGNISATNYFGMNYEVSITDGKILNGHLSK